MTLEELEKTLPNGLHDAEVKRIAVDYELRTVTLELAVGSAIWTTRVSDVKPTDSRVSKSLDCVSWLWNLPIRNIRSSIRT